MRLTPAPARETLSAILDLDREALAVPRTKNRKFSVWNVTVLDRIRQCLSRRSGNVMHVATVKPLAGEFDDGATGRRDGRASARESSSILGHDDV